jgi:hypothetical protein
MRMIAARADIVDKVYFEEPPNLRSNNLLRSLDNCVHK